MTMLTAKVICFVAASLTVSIACLAAQSAWPLLFLFLVMLFVGS